MPDPASRAVVSDDGSAIWLTVYSAAGDAVPVALLPVRAVALAGELIEAAVPKLNVTAKSAVTTKRRGGDPYAERRRRRNEILPELASLIAPGKPPEQQAREIARRLARFQAMPEEKTPARRLMQEIEASRLPVGWQRIRKILVKQKTRLVDRKLT
jgi:hypothetical protein